MKPIPLEELGIDGKDNQKEKPPHPRTIFRLIGKKVQSAVVFLLLVRFDYLNLKNIF